MSNSNPTVSNEAIAAARELRIKIHSFETKGKEAKGILGALNPVNAKWLDEISANDAEIIDRHFAEFLKNRRNFHLDKSTEAAVKDWNQRTIHPNRAWRGSQ
jgi:hypothetical protein